MGERKRKETRERTRTRQIYQMRCVRWDRQRYGKTVVASERGRKGRGRENVSSFRDEARSEGSCTVEMQSTGHVRATKVSLFVNPCY